MPKIWKVMVLAAISLALLESNAKAQLVIVKEPKSGSAVISAGPIVNGSPKYASALGIAPEYTADVSLPAPNMPGEYSGNVSVGNGTLSGKLSVIETYNFGYRAESYAAYSMDIYADVVPGSNVRINFQGKYSISWTTGSVMDDYTGFSFYPVTGPSKSGGLSKVSYSLPSGNISDSAQFVADVQPSAASAISSGGNTYYKLGSFSLTGRGGLGSSNSSAAVTYKTEITGIQAHYIGPALTIYDAASNNQAGLISEELSKPLSVKVSDNETGGVVAGAPITFTITEPVNGARFPDGKTSSVVLTNSDGIAEAALTLGSVTGSYSVRATCPAAICTSGGNAVTFAAVAGTLNLAAVEGTCQSNSAVSQRPAALRVGAFNTATGKYETSRSIYFSPVSFTDMSGYTFVGFPENEPLNCVVLPNGYRSCSPGPLKREGTYVFKADCPQCLGVKSVICRSYTHKRNVPAALPEASSANPFDRDPITNKPLTPVVRVKEVVTQNTNESFTSDAAENLIRFKALVLPDDFAEESVVTWNVIDDPRDNYESAIPAQNPVPATDSKFDAVYRVWLDNVDGGRPSPLRYLVTAKAVAGDKEVLSPFRELKQDETDKCRQEYVDYNIGLTEVSKSRFTAGLHLEYSKQVRDCFAYIYPAREAQKVDSLRAAGHAIVVTSGYRSPRHNILYVKSTVLSAHLYGEAVDVNPNGVSLAASAWKELWEAPQSTCGKILETGRADTMLWCANGETDADMKRGSAFPTMSPSSIYSIANCIHLGNLKH